MATAIAEGAERYGDLLCYRLTLPCGDSLLVALQGAHILSWTVGGVEQLYMSPRALLDGHSPIRGGVPVCFPQFNQRGPLPKHGFARTTLWELQERVLAADGSGSLVLALSDSAATQALWPYRFTARLVVLLAPGALRIELQVDNLDSVPFAFSGALHTYLAVEDVAQTQLLGLDGQAEWDSVTDTHALAAPALTFAGEFDRVYSAAPEPLKLRDGARRVRIAQSPDWAHTVVWNPGAGRCAQLIDMPPDGYARMLCVEAAQVLAPITVPVGQRWSGWQHLVSTIEPC